MTIGLEISERRREVLSACGDSDCAACQMVAPRRLSKLVQQRYRSRRGRDGRNVTKTRTIGWLGAHSHSHVVLQREVVQVLHPRLGAGSRDSQPLQVLCRPTVSVPVPARHIQRSRAAHPNINESWLQKRVFQPGSVQFSTAWQCQKNGARQVWQETHAVWTTPSLIPESFAAARRSLRKRAQRMAMRSPSRIVMAPPSVLKKNISRSASPASSVREVRQSMKSARICETESYRER